MPKTTCLPNFKCVASSRSTRKFESGSPKWPSNVTQGHREWHGSRERLWLPILTFHSSYGTMSYHFRDTIRYWLKTKNPNFWHPHLYFVPPLEMTLSEFHSRVSCGKTRMMEKWDGKFSPFRHNTRMWRTDRQTDTACQQRPYYAYRHVVWSITDIKSR